ncbi:MAG: hypothetical protein DLM59_08245 [Pseudonocardiales bacterium]|nr:MAG: hypothetical protein DLM59_08245 [Pseudonocardiales bacterium]
MNARRVVTADPACPGCAKLLDELDYATRAMAALNRRAAAVEAAAPALCLLCEDVWRALVDRGEDPCGSVALHCATVECGCPCHDREVRPAAASLSWRVA